jgi:hypothetical protein
MGNLFDKIEYLHLPYVQYDGSEEMAEQIENWTSGNIKRIADPTGTTHPLAYMGISNYTDYGMAIFEGDYIIQMGPKEFLVNSWEVFKEMGHFMDPIRNGLKVEDVVYIRSDITIEIVMVWPLDSPERKKIVRVYNDQGLYFSVLVGEHNYINFINGDTSARVFCGNEIEAYDYIRRMKI